MRENGVLISADGPDENVLKIKPPMVIKREDVDHFMNVFEKVFKELLV